MTSFPGSFFDNKQQDSSVSSVDWAQASLPEDLRRSSFALLPSMVRWLRGETLKIVSSRGGHLGASLGVIELSVALHYVFDTPRDCLVWDIGHQCLPHKILTGRYALMDRFRQAGGVAGFLRRDESPYDVMGAGHSSTSLSTAAGLAWARDRMGLDHHVVAVIGDAAMGAGMAFEALNHLGALGTRVIIILNDNRMSIAPGVGALRHYFNQLLASSPSLGLRQLWHRLLAMAPEPLRDFGKRSVTALLQRLGAGEAEAPSFFEALGVHYLGPLDGHDLSGLVTSLTALRDDTTLTGPILLHIKTEKGRGYPGDHACDEAFHAVRPFDLQTGQQRPFRPARPHYTTVFAETLSALMDRFPKIAAITAAMPGGTGLSIVQQRHADRVLDVGIAEQHAVTLAAGMACAGWRPVVAIYATFMQRAYDQVIHDVVLQGLPVCFALDRAGYVGLDGPTHHGSFDLVSVSHLPGVTVMVPADEVELASMLATGLLCCDGPSFVRFPRGEGRGLSGVTDAEPLMIGKGRIMKQWAPVLQSEDSAPLRSVAFFAVGPGVYDALEAGERLAALYPQALITVADARFVKPLDCELLVQLATHHRLIVTIEDGSSGGFAAHVLEALEPLRAVLSVGVLPVHYPDVFEECDESLAQRARAGLSPEVLFLRVQAAWDGEANVREEA